jgi:hypothetical protein
MGAWFLLILEVFNMCGRYTITVSEDELIARYMNQKEKNGRSELDNKVLDENFSQASIEFIGAVFSASS